MSNRLVGKRERGSERGSERAARKAAADASKQQFMPVARIALAYAAPVAGFEAACVVSCHVALEAKAGRFTFAAQPSEEEFADHVRRRVREVLVKDWTEWDDINQHRPVDLYEELREYRSTLAEHLTLCASDNEYLLRRTTGGALTREDRDVIPEERPFDPESVVGVMTQYLLRVGPGGDRPVEARLVNDPEFFAAAWPLLWAERESLECLFRDTGTGHRGDPETYADDRAEHRANCRPVGWAPSEAELCILWALFRQIEQCLEAPVRLAKTRRAYQDAMNKAEREARWKGGRPIWYAPTTASVREVERYLDAVEELVTR